MFKKYIAYLKDNPEKLWFKRRLYGWGWVPARWQGWFVILIFIALLVWNGFTLDESVEPTKTQLLWFLGRTVVLVAVLLFVCWKTGEKPRWQWGLPKNDSELH